jgi:hypothetical protein
VIGPVPRPAFPLHGIPLAECQLLELLGRQRFASHRISRGHPDAAFRARPFAVAYNDYVGTLKRNPDMLARLSDAVGAVLAAGIRAWVRITGRRVAKQSALWLDCPMGPPGRIGAEFYDHLVKRDGLRVAAVPDAGLLPSFAALRGPGFDPDAIHPTIRDFYEHTARYHLDAWSEASVQTRFFLWVLTRFVSRRMDQLNFPVSSLQLGGGLTSTVLPMVDGATGEHRYTGWLRRFAATNQVIYTGLYSVGRPPGSAGPCVKVSFPLPYGSSTVFFRPEAQPDGSYRIVAKGNRFGETGFYRMVVSDADHWKVRYLRTLHEEFHLYLDADGVLRTDHTVRFLGLTVFRMHYKMTPAARR